MKKALIVLLLLAFVGSGLFAQSFTWTGYVASGLGLTKWDGNDQMSIGLRSAEGNGAYGAELYLAYANADETAGLTFGVDSYSGADDWTANLAAAYIWGKFSNGLFKLLGGVGDAGEYTSTDPWYTPNDWGGWGLQLSVYPTDSIQFGVGAFTDKDLTEQLPLDEDTYVAGWLGVAGSLPDLLDFAAQLTVKKDAPGAFASFAITAVPILALDLYARAYDFGNLADHWDALLRVGYKGITGLTLNAFAIPSADKATGDDLAILLRAQVAYAIGNITPGLFFDYGLQGREYNGYYGNTATFDKDSSFMGIRPYVNFTVAPGATFTLGYEAGIDQSKNNRVPGVGTNGGMNHFVYTHFSYSF